MIDEDQVEGRAPEQVGQPRPLLVAAAAALVGLPLVVAAVALRSRHWYPVLDLAMTEFRVRDVGTSHTPLIGLPGRIGEYPDQGSHPGPMSFYLLAPGYRLLGSSAWALQAATVAVHLVAIATALWIGRRRAGWWGVAGVAAVLVLAVRGYGQVVLTQPWNPYLPLLAWIVLLLAAWSVLCGDHRMLIPLVVAGSLCAQTHVPYGPLVASLGVLAVGAVVVQLRRTPAGQRGPIVRSLAWGGGLGALLWLPPVIDQLSNRPGNIRQLLDHFGSPPEPPLGFGEGVKLALQHLDVWSGVARQVVSTRAFFEPASSVRGGVLLAAWAVAALIAARRGSAPLRALHIVVGVALLAGTISMARIFGLPWFYLTLWAWSTMLAAIAAVVWTAAESWRARRRRAAGEREEAAANRWLVALAAGVGVVSLASAVAFADPEVPEERLSRAVGSLSGPTYQAIVDHMGPAVGDDGAYQVRWSDASDIGSPGMGLMNELERRGLHVTADDFFDVPVTTHRVGPREQADAQIQLATGAYIEAWRRVPGAVEVASVDTRSDEQRAEYAAVRARLLDRLHQEGLDGIAPLVDTNLFGASLDPRLSADDRADLGRLILLGQPMAVFLAPPSADADLTTP